MSTRDRARHPIIHTPTRNSIAVAEHTIALMIPSRASVPRTHVSREWTNPMDATRFQGREVSGTVGVIGPGNIGGWWRRERGLGAASSRTTRTSLRTRAPARMRR
jgi:phosphoglycerate dehydrogenase-like enzyme